MLEYDTQAYSTCIYANTLARAPIHT